MLRSFHNHPFAMGHRNPRILLLFEMRTEKTTEEILNNRSKQYGKFKDVAKLSRDFKKMAYAVKGRNQLSETQIESLDMIFMKISRILNGDHTKVDSWDDIAGYALLVADELRGIYR